MVSEKIISKSIDDAIFKCGQRLTLNKSVTSVLNKFQKETINRKTEKGILINDKGEIIHSKNGSKHQVDIWKGVDMRRLYEENGAFHIEHNHPHIIKNYPYSECLSNDDIENVINKVKQADGRGGLWEEYCVKSITAEGTNGSRMTLVRGDNFSENDEKMFNEAKNDLNKYYDKYINKYYDLQHEIFNKLVKESQEKNGFDETALKINDLDNDAMMEAIKELGVFEKNEDFKNIQKKFSKANCKLIVESGDYV